MPPHRKNTAVIEIVFIGESYHMETPNARENGKIIGKTVGNPRRIL
jgi:hypothetical protein